MQAKHLITLLALASLATLGACGKQESSAPADLDMPPAAEAPAVIEDSVDEAAAPEATETEADASAAAVPADAAEAPAAVAGGDPEVGRIKYNSTCAGCHGKNGEGMGMFPKVSGQSAEMLAAKMHDYKAGKKVGPQSAIMHANTQNLSEDDINALVAHMSSFGG